MKQNESTKWSIVMRHSHSGFSLIELLITVAVIGILAAVAVPSYQQYVVRGKRAAAQAEMMDIANRQQQYLLANRQYTTALTDLGYTLPSEVGDSYSCGPGCITLGSGGVPTFTITFTAIESQASDGDLSLTNTGVKSPTDKW